MRIVRLSSVLLALLLCLPVVGQVQISIRRAAAVGGCTWTEVSDDFNRADADALGADWTETSQDTDIVSNEAVQTGTGLESTWDTEGATIAATQYVCVQRSSAAPSLFAGPKLRIPNLSCTGASYAARWDGANDVHVRRCTCESCTTFGTWAEALGDGNWLCAEVQGTGADTEFALWEFTSAPGARSTWRDPDACVCESGTCALYTCGTSISGEPGAGNYQDCGSGCYFGFYSGSSNKAEFDNFTGGWCD